MRRRKRVLAERRRQQQQLLACSRHRRCRNHHMASLAPSASWSILSLLHLLLLLLILAEDIRLASSMLLLKTNCLEGSPGCACAWKGGKFVADCSSKSLNQVPKNDYFDYLLANAGNNQMPTLNRDIQQLNLAANNITSLGPEEFSRKQFRNLQKIYLNANNLSRIHSSAFHKLTGLVELDLSENLIATIGDNDDEEHDHENDEISSPAEDDELSISVSGETKQQADERARGPDSGQRHQRRTTGSGNASLVSSASSDDRRTINSISGGNNKNGRPQTRSPPSSFLQDLTQLRQLNLASNQLSRLEKFSFSPLTQLRQLFLSRNQISFIDKRAFQGLNVLNILHLDGNKLSHLDGEILLKLPQLHAIQLAGSNAWRCDCRLRKLVRHLMPYKWAREPAKEQQHQAYQRLSAQKQQTTTTATKASDSSANILQDEPSCAAVSLPLPSATIDPEGGGGGGSGGSRSGDNPENPTNFDSPAQQRASDGAARMRPPDETVVAEPSESLLWTNMRLSEFECPPELAANFVQATPARNNEMAASGGGGSGNDANESPFALPAAPTAAQVMNMNDKKRKTTTTKDKTERGITRRLMLARRQHYLPGEPVELTCAFPLTDELDLELAQVEWWQLTPDRKPALLWRSNVTAAAAGGAMTTPLIINGAKWSAAAPTSGKQQQALKDDRAASVGTSIGGGKPSAAPAAGTLFAGRAGEYAIIDYVTRANGSRETAGATIDEQQGDSVADGQGQDERHKRRGSAATQVGDGAARGAGQTRRTRAGMKLIRVEHLILDAAQLVAGRMDNVAEKRQQQQQQFLCRVTNQAGQLNVLYSFTIDSASRRAQLEARHRQALRKQLVDGGGGESSGPAVASRAVAAYWPVSLAATIGSASSSAWPLERVKSAVARELDSMEAAAEVDEEEREHQSSTVSGSVSQAQLFIPIHLPEELGSISGGPLSYLELAASSTGVSGSPPGSSQARSHNQNQPASTAASDHQRPAARHTNGTSGSNSTTRIIHVQPQQAGQVSWPVDTTTHDAGIAEQPQRPYQLAESASAADNHSSGQQPLRRSINSVALTLIGRFTSNRRALFDTERSSTSASSDEDTDYENELLTYSTSSSSSSAAFANGAAGAGLIQVITEFGQPLGARLRLAGRLVYGRYLDRWVQLAIGESSLLLGICAGLLAGCLLTALIAVRLRCSRRSLHRVSDLSGDQLASKSAVALASSYDDDGGGGHSAHLQTKRGPKRDDEGAGSPPVERESSLSSSTTNNNNSVSRQQQHDSRQSAEAGGGGGGRSSSSLASNVSSSNHRQQKELLASLLVDNDGDGDTPTATMRPHGPNSDPIAQLGARSAKNQQHEEGDEAKGKLIGLAPSSKRRQPRLVAPGQGRQPQQVQWAAACDYDDRFVVSDSLCQSADDEGDVSGALDADLEDSIEYNNNQRQGNMGACHHHHDNKLTNELTGILRASSATHYYNNDMQRRQQQQQAIGRANRRHYQRTTSGADTTNTLPSSLATKGGRHAGEHHRLIVVTPQQELQELMVASAFYADDADTEAADEYGTLLHDQRQSSRRRKQPSPHHWQHCVGSQQVELTSDPDTTSTPIDYHHYSSGGGGNRRQRLDEMRGAQQVAAFAHLAPLDGQLAGFADATTTSWPANNVSLDGTANLEDSSSAGSLLLTSSQLQPSPQFLVGQATTRLRSDGDTRLALLSYTSDTGHHHDGIFTITGGHDEGGDLDRGPTGHHFSAPLQHQLSAAHHQHHQTGSRPVIVSSPSVASPSSNSLTRRAKNCSSNHQQQQQVLVANSGSQTNPNVVFLDDALQLLQASMDDCLLIEDGAL